MKCLVRLCPNTRQAGRFRGDLCAPCHETLSAEMPGGDSGTSASSQRILATVMLGGASIFSAEENAPDYS